MQNCPEIISGSGLASQSRAEEVDMIKALAIICMVAGHAGFPFNSFIHLFHMAVFFMASGFFFKEKYSSNFKAVECYAWKKIKGLWVPYFVWIAIYILLNNLFIRINLYTDNPDILLYVQGKHIGTHSYLTIPQMLKRIGKAFLWSGSSQMAGAFWFFKTLFFISIGYCLVDYGARVLWKDYVFLTQFIVSVVLLGIGFFCASHGISWHGVELICSYYCLFFLGHCLGKIVDQYRKWSKITYLGLFALSFFILLLLNRIGSIGLSVNEYENPAFLLITAFVGWIFLYSAGFLICNANSIFLHYIKTILSYIAVRTRPIIILHFLSFKIINFIICIVYKLPLFCVAVCLSRTKCSERSPKSAVVSQHA